MSDPRLTPFSGRVAHEGLRGLIDAPRFTEGEPARIIAPLVDLLRRPTGPRDRQLLRGARARVIDREGTTCFVQAEADGYCGWLRSEALGPDRPVTHRVHARATHLYAAPDIKSPETGALSLNARLEITESQGSFLHTGCGHWVPRTHLSPCDRPAEDPVAVAETLLGAPYLWGGNSQNGLDCSGLVQLALDACGLPCPGDSDLQEAALGPKLPLGTALMRGDLLFWRGHVAWVFDPETILHANAHSMSVTLEPAQQAIARIACEGPLTSHVRLSL